MTVEPASRSFIATRDPSAMWTTAEAGKQTPSSSSSVSAGLSSPPAPGVDDGLSSPPGGGALTVGDGVCEEGLLPIEAVVEGDETVDAEGDGEAPLDKDGVRDGEGESDAGDGTTSGDVPVGGEETSGPSEDDGGGVIVGSTGSSVEPGGGRTSGDEGTVGTKLAGAPAEGDADGSGSTAAEADGEAVDSRGGDVSDGVGVVVGVVDSSWLI